MAERIPALWLALSLIVVPALPAAGEARPPVPDRVDPVELPLDHEIGAPAWAPIGNPRHPDGRSVHLMTWAEGLDRLIVVGGYTAHGLDDDVWTLDPSNMAGGWHRVAVTGELPEIRHYPRGVWDPTGRRLVVYGGAVPDDSFGSCAGDGCALYGLRFPNDLWELAFDGSGTAATWRRLHAGGRVDSDRRALLPSGRIYHGMVYDSKNDRLLLHGGYDQLNHVQAWNAFVDAIQSIVTQRRFFKYSVGDTWAFDLAGDGGWELLHADGPRRASHPAVYDPVNHQLVITGGNAVSDEQLPQGATASFDLQTKTWTAWVGVGTMPLEYYDVAYDYSASFGGALFYGPAAWSHDKPKSRSVHGLRFGPDGAGAEWVTLPPRNLSWSPLYGMRAAVLPDGRLYTFGGDLSGSFDPRDGLLRSFDPVSRRWHRPPASLQPVPGTFAAASALDPVRRRLYVTGGERGPDSLWMLDLATEEWQPIEAGPAPRGPIAVDPSAGRLFSLEGCSERVWTLAASAEAWSQLSPVGRPPRLCSPELVFDVLRNRLLLFGGQVHGDMGGQSHLNTDVFALELGGAQPMWRRLEAAGDAPKPAGGAFQQPHVPPAYDPHRDRVLVRSTTDTWHAFEMSGARDGSWSALATQGQGPTGDFLSAFDVANDRLLTYEACDDGRTHALSFDGVPTWSLVEAEGARVRCGATAVYDPTGKRLISFGGYELAGGPPTSTADAFALPLGGTREPSPRPSLPYDGPLPGQTALSPQAWQRWGPQHAHTHDVDIAPDGSALIASTATTEYEPGGAGIYRAASPGEVWQPGTGDVVGHGMIEVAAAPSDPATVYATSLSLTNSDLRFGTGVYVSRDGGASWSEGQRGLPADSYWALAVHPRAPAIAWVAGKKGGLFETRDAGTTWTEVARGGLADFWINSLAVTETATEIRLLAGLRQQGNTVVGDGGVAYSDDAGRTWEVAFLTEQQAVKAIAVDPSNPARVVAAEGYGVWRSEDAGSTWEHVNGGTWREPTGDDIHLGSIEFDPTSGGRVLYGGGLTYPCDIKDYAPSGAALPPPTPGLFRSGDGGRTWNRIEDLGADELCGLAVSVDGRTVIASGLGGGARISTDRGATWGDLNAGITQEMVVSAAAHPTNPDIVVAALGPGGVMRTDDGGRTWEQTLGEDGQVGATSVVAVPAKPGRFLLMTVYAVYVSEDSGRTWKKTKAPGFGWDFYPSGITPHPTDPDTWYFDATSPTGSGFGVTRDNGATHEFTEVRDPATRRVAACGYSHAVAASDPERIYMADACGAGVFRSTDGGRTWTHLSSVLADSAVASVAVSPTDPEVVWVGTEHRGVWVSRDGGETWRSMYDPLGWEDIRSVAIDPNDPQHVVVSANEVGIFSTHDGGATWNEMKRGTVSHSPWAVQIDARGRVLAGTATGGVLMANP